MSRLDKDKYNEDWGNLIFGLEKALAAAKTLRTLYSRTAKTPLAEGLPLTEDLSIPKILILLAKGNQNRLVVKKVIGSIAACMGTTRDGARNNIYSSLYNNKEKWTKVSPGVYQLKDLNE